MCKSTLSSMLLVFGLSLVCCGCGEQKKVTPPPMPVPAVAHSKGTPDSSDSSKEVALSPTETLADNPTQNAKPDKSAGRDNKAKPKTNSKASPKIAKEARPFTEAAYVPNEVVGIMVAHPKQFSESPIGRLVTELGMDDSSPATDIIRKLHVKFEEIERVTFVIDQALVNTFARQSGLEVVDAENDDKPALSQNQLKNSLKQMGLAFHNYHDVNSTFPRADGDGWGDHTGLSWRVYLLPFLDEAALYNQFHMDEPWDSEHNKTLISKMPKVFQSPGVTDDEKTAFHVFTGEKTPFTGAKGTGIRNFTDGTSNSILAVLAGSDTAEIWTKPGGLDVDLNAPKKSLGEIKDDSFLTLFADGSVHELPTSIDETTLANLIQPGDGNLVDIGPPSGAEPDITSPAMILTLSSDAKQAEIASGLLGESTEETHEGHSFLKNRTTALWFPDKRTMIAGGIESVKKIISTKQSGKSSTSSLIEQLQLAADYSVAIDVESQAPLIQQLVQMNPQLGMIMNVQTLTTHISATAAESEPIVEINITALDSQMAMGLSAIATMGLNQAKMAFQIPQAPNADANEEELQAIVKKLISSANVELNGDKIQFRITAPQGFDRLPELLKPTLMKARTAAKSMQQMNSMKQIGLAFHNHHDVFSSLPGAGRRNADGPVGLSWRVHLLPFLDQAPLYNQFKFDEPWDSDHNKTLIEKMPAIFNSPGVEDPQKTSFHVFTGPGSPFADDAAPDFRQFTDGTSNTFLAVLAGPDTAEIWTKPGGLDFDPEDPIKSLGDIIGDTFLALIADGSVRNVSKTTDATTLRKLIQLADGEPLQ